jgi:hypothetical protein
LDEVLNRALDRLGDDLVTIALYERAGYYSVDSEKILSQYYHLSGYPYAVIDGRILLDDMDLDSGPRFIESVVSESGLYYPPATGIAISSTASSRNVTVQVDVFANYEDDYKITAFLVENGIVGYQLVGDTPVNDYRHDHVARMLLTNASLGDSFHASAGETKSFTYTVSVPSDYNFANMEVVAYVQRSFGSRERYQSKDYGEWYVDNSRSAALLTTAPLEVQ